MRPSSELGIGKWPEQPKKLTTVQTKHKMAKVLFPTNVLKSLHRYVDIKTEDFIKSAGFFSSLLLFLDLSERQELNQLSKKFYYEILPNSGIQQVPIYKSQSFAKWFDWILNIDAWEADNMILSDYEIENIRGDFFGRLVELNGKLTPDGPGMFYTEEVTTEETKNRERKDSKVYIGFFQNGKWAERKPRLIFSQCLERNKDLGKQLWCRCKQESRGVFIQQREARPYETKFSNLQKGIKHQYSHSVEDRNRVMKTDFGLFENFELMRANISPAKAGSRFLKDTVLFSDDAIDFFIEKFHDSNPVRKFIRVEWGAETALIVLSDIQDEPGKWCRERRVLF